LKRVIKQNGIAGGNSCTESTQDEPRMESAMNRFHVTFLANLNPAQGDLLLHSSSASIWENTLCFEYGRLLFARPFGSGTGNSLHHHLDLIDS
jgi:hypothetical protein